LTKQLVGRACVLATGLLAVALAMSQPPFLARAAAPPGLKVTVLAGGAVEVTDNAVFDAVFDPAQEGGITRLYDPSADPGRANNLGPPAGYTVFNTYLNANGWADIGGGPATTLEILRNSPSSVVIHAVGQFMHEDGSGAVAGLQHETWTTLYPGGRAALQRRLLVGSSPVAVTNFAGKAVDLSTAATWSGIFTGVATDTSWGSGTDAHLGNGTEGWIGFYQPSQLGVGTASWSAADFSSTVPIFAPTARRSGEWWNKKDV